MKLWKKCLKRKSLWAALFTSGCLSVLTGCHGQEGIAAFEMPEEFDSEFVAEYEDASSKGKKYTQF